MNPAAWLIFVFVHGLGEFHAVKPVTHLEILYADHGNQRKSPGVPGAAMAIFADLRNRPDIGD